MKVNANIFRTGEEIVIRSNAKTCHYLDLTKKVTVVNVKDDKTLIVQGTIHFPPSPMHGKLGTQYVQVEDIRLKNNRLTKRSVGTIHRDTTQKYKLLMIMANGGKVTRLSAMLDYRIQNLTARMTDLRKRGIHITVTTKTDAHGNKYAEYTMSRTSRRVALSKRLLRKRADVYVPTYRI